MPDSFPSLLYNQKGLLDSFEVKGEHSSFTDLAKLDKYFSIVLHSFLLLIAVYTYILIKKIQIEFLPAPCLLM